MAARRASVGEVAKAVLWAALGVRRRADHERTDIPPLAFVVGALAFAVAFVGTLLLVVRIVTS